MKRNAAVSQDAWPRTARRSTIELLRQRDFSLLFASQAVSKVGNSAYQVALGWSVYQITGSAADMGMVLAVNVAPQILLTLFGGVLGDRLPRKTVIINSDAASAVVTGLAAVAALAGELRLWMLVLMSAVLGTASAFYGPAYRAILPDVIDSADLQRANGISNASLSAGRIIGPSAAGIAFAWRGSGTVFAFDAATFLVSVICVLLIRSAPGPVRMNRSLGSDLRDGLSYVVKTKWLGFVITLSLAANTLTLAPLLVLLPLIVRLSGGGPRLLGAAMAVQAGAAVAGALLIARINLPRWTGRLLAGLAALMAVGAVLVGAGPRSSSLILLGTACVGLGFGFDVVENTMIQSLVPNRYLARVYSVNLLGSFALFPVSYLAFGFLARLAGAAPVLYACGAVMLAGCLAAGCYRPLSQVGAAVGADQPDTSPPPG